jgi:serine/threonine-protein kinase
VPLLTAPERIGTRVGGRYDLRHVVGEGASAVLFAAHDLALGRDVGVKVMRPTGALSSSQARSRFQGEAQTLAKLRHPHLLEVYDVGETDDGMPYLVVELLHGETLAARLERGAPLSVAETLSITLPLMGALACAHQAGVIHRDIKPANIFLHRRSGAGQAPDAWPATRNSAVLPKLLDFGIAKLAGERPTLTTEGMTLGTPSFMAPEQARGEQLGPAADVWAMGVTIYQCLSGKLPFDAPTAAGVLWQATQHGAPPLSHIDAGVALTVKRALAAEPARRLGSMHALARSLVDTARRAGLEIPADPDPVGLPDYRAWCLLADAEPGTEQLPTLPSAGGAPFPAAEGDNAVVASVASSSRVPALGARARTRPLRVVATLGGLIVILVLSMRFWPHGQRGEVTPYKRASAGASAPQPPAALVPAPAARPAAALAQPVVDPTAPAPTRPTPAPEPDRAAHPAHGKVTRRSRPAKLPAQASNVAPQRGKAETQAHPTRALVEQWDW